MSSGRVLQGADSTHSADSTIEAGLPNITGELFPLPASNNYQIFGGNKSNDGSGALLSERLSKKSNLDEIQLANYGLLYNHKVTFNASRSSAIYGSSNTVQPPAYIVHIWKRVS